MSGGAPLAAALATVLAMMLAGCPGSGGPGAAPPQGPPGAPEVTIDVADGIAFGDRPMVTVHVRNTSHLPIALVGLVLRNGERMLHRVDASEAAASFSEDGGGAIEGTLLVEDPGPMARAPMPPRWEWRGDAGVVSPVVIPRYGVFSAGANFLVYDDAARKVEALLFYAAIPTGTAIYAVENAVAEAAAGGGPEPADASPAGAPGMGSRSRWAPSLRARASLRPILDLPSDIGQVVTWRMAAPAGAPDGPPPLARGLPALHRSALRKEAVAGLDVKGAQVGRVLALAQPHLDVQEARSKALIFDGPAIYVAAAQAWALEPRREDGTPPVVAGGAPGDDRRAALVSSGRVVRVAGSLCDLAEAICLDGSAEVVLYARAGKEDPDGLGAALLARAVPVSHREEKGGTFRGEASVRPESLAALLETLSEKGLILDGRKVRKP